MQKSWIEKNEIIIFHFAYDRIMSDISAEMIDQNKKFKIMIFVLKKSTLKITFKSDISNDSNVQILHITDIDINDCMIINFFFLIQVYSLYAVNVGYDRLVAKYNVFRIFE